jgi:hypothetical protein
MISLLIACGSQESGTPATGGDAASPAPSQAGETAAARVETPAPPAPEAPEAPPEVASCLSLVKQGEYAAAVDVCLAALRDSPGNAEVESALAKAREETTRQAAAQAAGMAGDSAAGMAGDSAAGMAGDSAAGAAADAAGGTPEMPKGLTP